MALKKHRLKWLCVTAALVVMTVSCGSSPDDEADAISESSTTVGLGSDEVTTSTTSTTTSGPTTTRPATTTTEPATTTQPTTTTTQPTTTTQATTTTTPATTTTTTQPATTTTTTQPATTSTTRPSMTIGVSVFTFGYSPDPVTVKVGDTVMWTNDSPDIHTTTSSGGWDSGNMAAGATYSRVFDTPGTFTYFCTIHTARTMSGTVVVNP